MKSHPPLRSATLFIGVAITLASAGPLLAQQAADTETPIRTPAPTDVFPFEIGHASRAGIVYTVSATQPPTSGLTGQKIRLKTVGTTVSNRTTHYFTLATGKHKTDAEIDTILTGIFRRFVTQTGVANQELGKIGDLSQGGEVRFVAESTDDLRLDNLRPNEPAHSSHYRRADIEAFLTALTGAPPA